MAYGIERNERKLKVINYIQEYRVVFASNGERASSAFIFVSKKSVQICLASSERFIKYIWRQQRVHRIFCTNRNLSFALFCLFVFFLKKRFTPK